MFGHWRYEADSGDLYDGQTTIRLEPQVGKLLEHFLSHQGRVVSREELIADVWRGRVVSDDAINRCVSILRQTLSPNDKQAYIETVVRKGYLAHFPTPSVVSAQPAPSARRNKQLLAAVLFGLVALGLFVAVFNFDNSDSVVATTNSNAPPMVAVLPFSAIGRTADGEFFATGVHNDLLTQLSYLRFQAGSERIDSSLQ